ncbi:MAG TPA: hypothetical protein VIK63_01865 [Haloplasmataceae bacterium]
MNNIFGYRHPNIHTFGPPKKGDERHFAIPLLFGLALTAPFWARRYPVFFPYPVPRPFPYLYPYYPSPFFYYYRQPWIYY